MKTSALIYIAITIFVAGFTLGWSAHVQWVAGDNMETIEDANAEREALGEGITDIAIGTERDTGEVQIVYKTIEKEVIRYVETPTADRTCLDPAAVGLLNQAAGGANVPVDP